MIKYKRPESEFIKQKLLSDTVQRNTVAVEISSYPWKVLSEDEI